MSTVSEVTGEPTVIGVVCGAAVPIWSDTVPSAAVGAARQRDRDDQAGVAGDLRQVAGAGLGACWRAGDRRQPQGGAAQGRPAGGDVDAGDLDTGRHGDRQQLAGRNLITGVGDRRRRRAGAARGQRRAR